MKTELVMLVGVQGLAQANENWVYYVLKLSIDG